MDIKPIKSEADHEAALREIETLWGAAEGTMGGDRLDVLATLIEAYEEKCERADIGAALEVMTRERGETPRDGDEIWGGK
jgi:HTH-type transcriptional regulator / antitoxin HigA